MAHRENKTDGERVKEEGEKREYKINVSERWSERHGQIVRRMER